MRFSNENMLVQIDENVREADVFVIQPSCPPVSDGIIELLITIDALKHASAGRITAVLPYFPTRAPTRRTGLASRSPRASWRTCCKRPGPTAC